MTDTQKCDDGSLARVLHSFDDRRLPLETEVGAERWRLAHRAATRVGLARAMQTYTLGSIHEGVGEHYLEAAARAMDVLLPLDSTTP
jgi:hypothetical protein